MGSVASVADIVPRQKEDNYPSTFLELRLHSGENSGEECPIASLLRHEVTFRVKKAKAQATTQSTSQSNSPSSLFLLKSFFHFVNAIHGCRVASPPHSIHTSSN